MWLTLFIMGVAVSLEPIRIGLTVLMLNRPRPMLQLFAFLCGGFTMGVGAGLVVLLVLGATPVADTAFTVQHVQVAIGLLAIVVAILLATNVAAPKMLRRPALDAGADAAGAPAPDSVAVRAASRLSGRARQLMRSGSPWIAGVTGLSIALPSVDYMAALAVILASGAGPAGQAVALVAFNMVAFAMVEIPLLSYLVAPARTLAAMEALNAWIRSRTKRDVAMLLAAAGAVMLTIGMTGLA